MVKPRTRTLYRYPTVTPTTGWFSSVAVPVHEGEYEVECLPHREGEVPVIDRMKFHGGHWFHMNGEMSESGLGTSRWRGLAQRS